MKITIAHVVAASQNNAIGIDGKLLWHLPNDMRFFKNTTWGMPVIMGRKTFESMGKRLPGRISIVITRQKNWFAEGVTAVSSIDEALRAADATNCNEWYIIGGGEIYRESMGIINTIYMTRVHVQMEGDTFYPEIDESKWQLSKSQSFKADEKHQWDYTFEKWERRI